MIVSKIRGGLGNQLFEWAAGFALAKTHETDLFLDLSVFERNKIRDFELEKLSLPFKVADESLVDQVKQNNIYRQLYYHFDPDFFSSPDNTFLRGYFCSERYFAPAIDQIKDYLVESIELVSMSTNQVRMLDTIKKRESIAIHIRRGDYVSNDTYNQFFGTCSLDYYAEAVNKVIQLSEVKDPLFVVFSDDLQWAEENLALENDVVFVDVNRGGDDYLDMLFMAKCDHAIIANSTFSWWSAWINPNPSKVVIAPSRWFQTNYREKQKGAWIQSSHYDTKDLFPNEWNLI